MKAVKINKGLGGNEIRINLVIKDDSSRNYLR